MSGDEHEYIVQVVVKATNQDEAVRQALLLLATPTETVVGVVLPGVGTWTMNLAGHPELFPLPPQAHSSEG